MGLPVFGKLCDLFDRKRLYLLGLGLFAAASRVCGLADDLATLVAARVVQGMGGAPILVPGPPVNVPLLEAVVSGLLVLSGFALVAAVVSLLRRDQRA